jgi:lipoprotein-anchoring transpeptidase ErfK/SrfK
MAWNGAKWAAAGLLLLGTGVAIGLSTDAPAALAPVIKAKPAPKLVVAPVKKVAPKPAPAPAAESFVVRSALTLPEPLSHGDWYWDESAAPAGTLVVTVDLKAETLSVFRDGHEIGVAAILYGGTDKPSPTGVFPITQMRKDHISNLYNAPMPYMMRLTNDGVAIHGSDVKWGSATHGCIGVPTPFAAKLFAQAKLGTRVIVTNGQRLQLGGQVGD